MFSIAVFIYYKNKPARALRKQLNLCVIQLATKNSDPIYHHRVEHTLTDKERCIRIATKLVKVKHYRITTNRSIVVALLFILIDCASLPVDQMILAVKWDDDTIDEALLEREKERVFR